MPSALHKAYRQNGGLSMSEERLQRANVGRNSSRDCAGFFWIHERQHATSPSSKVRIEMRLDRAGHTPYVRVLIKLRLAPSACSSAWATCCIWRWTRIHLDTSRLRTYSSGSGSTCRPFRSHAAPIPAGGIKAKDGVAALPGARLISEQDRPVPGPNPSTYAFAKVSTQRNIYRVPVP
jgi:hypothetical protein